eukprot:588896-Rhodomonas_salina.4
MQGTPGQPARDLLGEILWPQARSILRIATPAKSKKKASLSGTKSTGQRFIVFDFAVLDPEGGGSRACSYKTSPARMMSGLSSWAW